MHEAYVRLIGQSDPTPTWANRGHFFAAAAEAMRRILIENARRKRGPKQGGNHQRVELEADAIVDSSIALPDISPWDLLSLDEALTRLAEHSSDHAQLVMLRFFAGLTMPEAANALGVSLSTAERQWAYTRAWLFAELRDRDESAPGKA